MIMRKRKWILTLPLSLILCSCEISFSWPNRESSSSSSISSTGKSDKEEDSSSSLSSDKISSSSSSKDSVSSSTSSSSKNDSSSSIDAPDGYHLTWSDEFSQSTLNTANWTCENGDGSQYGISGWGNNEKEYYRSQNASVQNGNLVLTAKKETYGGYPYTSARLKTQSKVTATRGRIEARISLPQGTGLWPAFWMLPQSNYENQGWPHSGEIDIMEAKGRLNNCTSAALHYSNDTNQHAYQTGSNVYQDDTTIDDYHTYGVEWTDSKMVFFCDSNQFFTVNRSTWHSLAYSNGSSGPFDQPFYVILNLAVGGQFDNNQEPASSFQSAVMKVDYVRIYSKD